MSVAISSPPLIVDEEHERQDAGFKEELARQGPITDEELVKFRQEWKQEVLSKKNGAGAGPSSRKEVSPSKAAKRTSPLPTMSSLLPDLDEIQPGPSRPKIPSKQPALKEKESAVQLYAKAVENEQSGRLNEALMLYRKAFKLDGGLSLLDPCFAKLTNDAIDGVERAYAKQVAAATALAKDAVEEARSVAPSSADVVSSAAPIDEPYSFERHIQLHPDYEKSAPPLPIAPSAKLSITTRCSPLTTIFRSLPVPTSDLVFLPQDEDLPLPLASLPHELMEPILSHLDVGSLERFGSTCWKARYLTSRAQAWQAIARGIYRPPAMVSAELDITELNKRHNGEWRTTVLEEERVRMDGCYISVCHYIRPGAGDQWVTITHLITYHRFLRFYPDGSVISFLTTEHPSDIVPILRPTLRAKGLHFGRWHLLRSDDQDENVDSPKIRGKPRAKIYITDLVEPGNANPKYEFEMDLDLLATGRGRWNKLDLANYSTINRATGEELQLNLKHQKPFYFSKVKSYNPPF
ncbi:F-box protein 9, partial [Tremellales sp. Uapishka_1]